MLLIDPPLSRNIRHSTTNELLKVSINEGSEDSDCLYMQYPSLTARIRLPDSIETWKTLPSLSSVLSTFDELLSVYSLDVNPANEDPTSCTTVFRRIMLSMWLGFLDRMKTVLANTHRQLWKGGVEKYPHLGYEWQEWLALHGSSWPEDRCRVLLDISVPKYEGAGS